MPDDPTFTLDQALRARAAIRRELGMGAESFGAEEFVQMTGEELDAMRAAGRSEEDIAAFVSEASGVTVSAADLSSPTGR